MIIVDAPPQCFGCENYLGKRTCRAYSEKIPKNIWINEFRHNKQIKGDGGIVFVKEGEPLRLKAK